MTSDRWRIPLLVLAGARGLVALLAVPLAPVLYEDHFLVLVLMRPTKEVLLAGGFLVRTGKIGIVPLISAAVPLSILGVWLMYYLGRQFADAIAAGELPRWADRILPKDRIERMCELLDAKGQKLVFYGRLAAFPSTMVAAAAGSADMPSRRFLPVDGAGGLLAIAEVVGAGFLLGAAYKQAGPWLVAVGVVVLVGVAVVVARYLRRTS